MTSESLAQDPVARSLAAKAYSTQLVTTVVGAIDEDAMREHLLMVWERHGRPPGAFLRAAILVTELPQLVAQRKASESGGLGVSPEQDLAAAKRAVVFLEKLALSLS